MVQESFELSCADGVLELSYGLGLHLADALESDLKDPPHLFERIGLAIPDPVSQLDNLALAI